MKKSTDDWFGNHETSIDYLSYKVYYSIGSFIKKTHTYTC